MERFRRLFGALSCCIAILLLSTSISQAGIIDIFVDTTPVQGSTGALTFDFIDGDGLVNNTMTVSGFTSDAVLSTGAASGDVTGGLSPGPLVLGDMDFFNGWLQDLTFGAFISFQLESTGNGSFSSPDSFSFSLLDSSLLPYATDDPLGTDALLILDISNANPVAQSFASASATLTVSKVFIPVLAPGTLLLFMIGGTGMLGMGLRKRGAYRLKDGNTAEAMDSGQV